MAEAKLSMSLDDIIKQSDKKRESKPKTTTRAKPTQERGNATNVRVVPRPRGITKRAPTSVTVSFVNRSDKRGAGGPRHPVTRKYIPRNEAQAQAPIPRGNSEARWRHDLYAESTDRPSRAAPRADGAKLLISNLDYNVSNDDIRELFETQGTLKRAEIIYDNSGRSEGLAEVTFAKRSDALKAQEKYNKVLLDGKKMVIVLEEKASGDIFSRLSNVPRNGGAGGRSGLQVTRTFQQATRSGSGQNTRSRAARTTGRMRGYADDDDVMEE